ncbi:DUF6481 family protein [Parasphingorhabdus sp.]|jgi:hypothetical protein|uniref:DUF6481 family protein n=1 Tax=Parasphingorhabdus sp. TaxID=2709688 RepID=UPI00300379A9
MPPFSEPTFQERTQMAAKAKQAALKQLKAQPTVSDEVLAERKAARLARDEKKALAREAKRAAFELVKAERKAAKEQAAAEKAAIDAAAAEAAAPPPPLTEAEKKAARDLRYAQRKKRRK